MNPTPSLVEQISKPIKDGINALTNGNKATLALLVVIAILAIALLLCLAPSRELKITDSDFIAQPSQPALN
jgi:hypothetical protein